MRAGCPLRPSPTRNRPGLIASIVVALLAAAWSACSTDSPTPLRPTASPPPNPTTLTGITISSTELILAEDETASIVIALDSDPGEDIEVWLRRGKTGADDIAFTRDRVTWAAADWREPRRLTLTAVVDYFAERLEAHELHVWTYRRGQIGAGQQILPKETIHVWVKDPLEPRAFTGGGAGEVVLEWPGWGGNGIQRWQYRYRNDSRTDWGAWADVPNSDADTRSYRVTGLSSLDDVYQFQLRPWGSTGPGAVSVVIGGYVAMVGSDGMPQETPGPLLEPGRRFRISDTPFTFVVPHGMILSTGTGGSTVPRETFIFLYDETTLTHMVIRGSTGETVQKTIWDPLTNSYQVIWTETGDIAESWSGVPPPPGHDPAARWEQIEQSIRWEPLP